MWGEKRYHSLDYALKSSFEKKFLGFQLTVVMNLQTLIVNYEIVACFF